MTRKAMKYICLVAILTCARLANGQPESNLALEYRFGLLTEATHAPNIVNQFLVPGTGTSSEHTIRFLYEHRVAGEEHTVSLTGGFGVAYSSGSFTSDPFSSPSKDFTLQYSALSLYLRATVGIPLSNFCLDLGGWLGAPVVHSLQESLVSGTTTTVIASNSAIDYTRPPAGIRAEVNYLKPLSRKLPITFGLFSELDLDAFRQMGMNATSAGIAIRWNLEHVGGGNSLSLGKPGPA